MTTRVCTACGHIGDPKQFTKGSTGIELLLWLLLIIPGLTYSIWRISSRYDVCQKCGATTLIPPDSPIGAKFIKDNSLIDVEGVESRAPSSTAIGAGRALGKIAGKLFKK